jgi:two-component system OmpR family response regulator
MSNRRANRGRVLLVEDHPAVREMLVATLTKAGFWVGAAADAAQARRITQQDRAFEVAVVDYVLPGEQGLVLAAYLAALGIAPILMTGDLTRIYLASSLPYPLLVKPFRPGQLVALVEKLLGDRSRR